MIKKRGFELSYLFYDETFSICIEVESNWTEYE